MFAFTGQQRRRNQSSIGSHPSFGGIQSSSFLPSPAFKQPLTHIQEQELRRAQGGRRGVEAATKRSDSDRASGQWLLWFIFAWVSVPLIVIFFAQYAIYKADFQKHGQRIDAGWRAACDANDVAALSALGLS